MKKENILHNRVFSFAMIFLIYAMAVFIGIITYVHVNSNVFIKVAAADTASTLFVFAFSIIFRNSSVYDPYWSVAPPVIIGLLMLSQRSNSLIVWLLFILISLWSIRLTWNWARGFKNLSEQDWRYTHYKENFPKVWLLSNLFGIHLIPTVVVYLCIIPAIYCVMNQGNVSAAVLLGAIICLFAVCVQYVSDNQMHEFRGHPENKGHVIRNGLWKYSRHPNYFGEISMWWGIFIVALASGGAPFISIAGAVANTALFIFVSIPLMEKRQLENKPEYRQYQEVTSMLVPMPPRKTEIKDDILEL